MCVCVCELVYLYMCPGLGRTPQQGAVTTINCAVNPSLNSQQAIYYDSNCRPELATNTARYGVVTMCMLELHFYIYLAFFAHDACELLS